MRHVRETPTSPGHPWFVKVPQITLYFWIVKLLSTAMGEATSDYLVTHISPYAAVLLGFVLFAGALVLQFAVRKYIAWVYWLAVVMVSIFGTMAADAVHIVLGIPYAISTAFFLLALLVLLTVWQRTEHTLSIHSITTRRREAFYWATIVATFALGTAAGDMTATTLHLGYLTSGLLFSVLLLLPALGYWKFRLNSVFAFWFSYIMTRPVGASFADWFGVSKSAGGLGVGGGPVSLVLTILIVIVVTYLAITRKDTTDGDGRIPSRPVQRPGL
ncbi:hypothetical protein JI721_16865 [Alicyclobacillus cycloheptanicus]|uniref:Membrane-anchored protein n=1 Tax=Alicyclobacillus cycloheptanicus TaxID=1457 RepID=A0ABT9XGC4_9BACL|nr:hypothetical protein [Alicyclobacillus cycloheptanicus]MDQ0189351.1 putative membrane-anchored protein [Alicyclobacillus cycloheptanicus]WDM01295.1 hypothetical protein JI721_16865 [Alicyclobacillus cycloheptanicus]